MRLLKSILLIFLIFPSAAQAVTWQEDYELANVYWGGPSPLCSSVTIESDEFLAEPGVIGQATIPSEAGTECSIKMKPGLSMYVQCYTMVHEDGHLHGYEHSLDPASIMYRSVPNSQSKVGLCDKQFGEILRQHRTERRQKR